MPTPRQRVAEQIAADNPKWVVLPYAHVPAQVAKSRPVCAVWRSDVDPAVSRQGLTHAVSVNVYASATGERGEDELDDSLDAVMLSIERLEGFKFERASRQMFSNDTLAGWHIELSQLSENVYRTHILKERAA